jgi:hypothetical protein
MGDNFPAVWLCLDDLCCRRCGRNGLSSDVVPQRGALLMCSMRQDLVDRPDSPF